MLEAEELGDYEWTIFSKCRPELPYLPAGGISRM